MKTTVMAMGMVLALTATVPAYGGTAGDRTLSPYFFVAGEDAAVDRFPLRDTQVAVEISGVIAHVTVRQEYVNDGATAINARYIFPGSTRAAVHGMKMVVGERVITARIEEKEAARRTFEAAKRAGKRASLLEQQRPNVFSMDVANIMPGDTVAVELRYTELLVPEDGTYEFVYPTVVGPRYSNMPEAGAPAGEKWVKNPYLTPGADPKTTFDITVGLHAGMPLMDATCASHETDITYESRTEAKVRLAGGSEFGGDRDFILRYRLADRKIASGLLLQEGGTENFFLLMVQPPERVAAADIPDREYIFVVDVSGSMNGFPLDTAKTLLRDLIAGLRTTDRFNVVLFAGSSRTLAETSLPASQANVDRAVRFIDDQRGGGGTELLRAMNRAMALPRAEGVSRTLAVVTDGYIHAEREVFAAIQENLGDANVFAFGIGSSVNRFLIEGMARSGEGEPFVVTRPAEAPAAAEKFRSYISAPVLAGIGIDFDGFDAFDVSPPAIPDLFAQRPVVVVGKWRGERAGTIRVTGTTGDGPYRREFPVAETAVDHTDGALRYLWARDRIARLSDFNPNKGNPENRSEIVSLGLTYNLLTAYTSFVAVDEVVANPTGEADDVKQPLPLPKNVSPLAVGGGMSSVPEPDLYLLAVAALALMLLGRWKRLWGTRRRTERS